MTDPRLLAYDYHLPKERIALYPAEERSASKLLVLNRDGLMDKRIVDLPDLFQEGDLLVYNNTKVLQARLRGHRKSGGKLEVFFLQDSRNEDGLFPVLIKPSRRLKKGEVIVIEREIDSVSVVLARYYGDGKWGVQIEASVPDLLEEVGQMPIPPYLNRPSETLDKERYQTVFAGPKGAVAAPTAGLHLTNHILAALEEKGVRTAAITLHVGVGTFRNVRTEDLDNQRLHSEAFVCSEHTASLIRETKENRGRVVAVGTTVTRCLESVFRIKGDISAASGYTDIFIQEGFTFQVIDGLLTNFHLPKSSLLMLVSAFAGRQRVLDAYDHAVCSEYRFFSYGDAMLIL